MKDYTTKELVNELISRQAVQELWIPPYEDFEITCNGEKIETEIDKGACFILIVWD